MCMPRSFIGPGTGSGSRASTGSHGRWRAVPSSPPPGGSMQRWVPNSPTWAVERGVHHTHLSTLNAVSVRFLRRQASSGSPPSRCSPSARCNVNGSLAIFGVIPVAGYQHAPMVGKPHQGRRLPQRHHAGVRHDSDPSTSAFAGTETHRRDRRRDEGPANRRPKATHTYLGAAGRCRYHR